MQLWPCHLIFATVSNEYIKLFQTDGIKTSLYTRSNALTTNEAAADALDSWKLQQVQLSTASNTYLQIEGVAGTNFKSDMAVDDVQVFAGSCWEKKTKQPKWIGQFD